MQTASACCIWELTHEAKQKVRSIMYADTITLFNHYKDNSGDIWYPTVIPSVNINVDKASIIKKYGSESKDRVVLNVRYRFADSAVMVGDKRYLPPKQWRKQGVEQLSQTITFSDGTDFDFFMVGDYGSVDIVVDDDYLDGFYDHMNKEHDYVFAITSVAKYSAIPHFEIMGA